MNEHQDEFRSGLWRYCPEKMALVFDGSSKSKLNPTYLIKLERIDTSGQLLDWILQLHGKPRWSKEHQKSMGMHPDYQVSDFITLVDLLCRYYLKENIQAAFSPFGQHRAIDWDKLISKKLNE